ncbi:MAG: hypothetical protein N3E40_07260, partial [Dehalococcoidia bacterium]|nr:hypothetical protein [Dehalococcoidia bacterium]
FLREGCQLVPDPERPPRLELVKYDGSRDKNFEITHDVALAYARLTASEFGVNAEAITFSFNPKLAQRAKELDKKTRKKLARSGPLSDRRIETAPKEKKGKKTAQEEE